MAHDLRELIELWDRAERVCGETSEIFAENKTRLEISHAILRERMVHLTEIRELVTRSRRLLARGTGSALSNLRF